MNIRLKKALYESIMKSVAKTVKRSINEEYSRDETESYKMTVHDCSALVICDPCYALDDDIYDDLFLALDNYKGEIGDAIGLVHGTYYGDGGYDSYSGKNYGVDAGSLGIYDIKYCKDNLESDSIRIIDIDEDTEHTVELKYDSGDFYFTIDGKLVEEIYTAPYDDDDEEDYDDDYWEDDEEYDENEF